MHHWVGVRAIVAAFVVSFVWTPHLQGGGLELLEKRRTKTCHWVPTGRSLVSKWQRLPFAVNLVAARRDVGERLRISIEERIQEAQWRLTCCESGLVEQANHACPGGC